jgi:hypothetical protein
LFEVHTLNLCLQNVPTNDPWKVRRSRLQANTKAGRNFHRTTRLPIAGATRQQARRPVYSTLFMGWVSKKTSPPVMQSLARRRQQARLKGGRDNINCCPLRGRQGKAQQTETQVRIRPTNDAVLNPR